MQGPPYLKKFTNGSGFPISQSLKFAPMDFRDAISHSRAKLAGIYEGPEAAYIAEWVVDHLTGTTKTDRMAGMNRSLLPEQELILEKFLDRLLQNEPVQYVLNEAWFCGLKFYVDPHVLIPRPETEELVEWIISNCKFPVDKLDILDIGSGSGCIAIALKRKLRKATVWSCDISPGALNVARKNATLLGVDVKFVELDFLDGSQRDQLPTFDTIVSNPPYIPEMDKAGIPANVLNYEPSSALFVPDKDPLIFYEAMAEFGKSHLNKNGSMYAEINEKSGMPVSNLFQQYQFRTELKKDISGKDRLIRIVKDS
jgi:release factor glutamine methyltransferase